MFGVTLQDDFIFIQGFHFRNNREFQKLEARADDEIFSFTTHLGIQRTYMVALELDLNNETIIGLEQLTRLIRDTMHYTLIKRMTPNDTIYRSPTYTLNGEFFTAEMEEARE